MVDVVDVVIGFRALVYSRAPSPTFTLTRDTTGTVFTMDSDSLRNATAAPAVQ